MKALIIAAGRGSRISSFSEDRPKPLLRLLGLSIIERVILAVRKAGIRDFVIVTGYRGEMIQQALGNGDRYGVKITYVQNDEWHRGNAVSVLKAKEVVGDRFLLLMGDHIFEPEIIKDLKSQRLRDALVALVVDPDPPEYIDMEDATKVLVNNGKVMSVGKSLSEYNAVDCGFFLCTREVFTTIEAMVEEGRESLNEVMNTIAASEKLKAVDCKGRFWIDIDTEEAFKKAESILCERLIKPTDGFISKTFNRPLSLKLSRYLVNTNITPNLISLFSFILSVLSAVFFAVGGYFTTVIGGLCVQLSSILDGCDGEVARLKFMESDYGAWFDSVLDRYADAIVIMGIVLGLIRYNPALDIWIIGYAVLTGSLLNSYTATKFDAVVKRKNLKWRFGRDTRLFLIMLGALINQMYYLLLVLAVLTNVVSIRRVYVLRKFYQV